MAFNYCDLELKSLHYLQKKFEYWAPEKFLEAIDISVAELLIWTFTYCRAIGCQENLWILQFCASESSNQEHPTPSL